MTPDFFTALSNLLPDFELEDTGGHVMVLVHYSSAGPVIGVSDACVVIYESPAVWHGEVDSEGSETGDLVGEFDELYALPGGEAAALFGALSLVIQALIRIYSKEDA